jgi:CubicO group peptidase (beta-lactamase class C family)
MAARGRLSASRLLAVLLIGGSGCQARPSGSAAAAINGDGSPGTTSVLLSRGAEMVHETYFRDAGMDTLHDVRSVTKSVTSLGVGIAIADGTIPSADAPAFFFLRDLAPFANDGPLKSSITIEDLLTMSSALDCDDNDVESPGNEENMYPRERWARWAVDLPTKPGYRHDARGRGPFAYCTAGVFLLGQILERATGQRADRYLEERLLGPLGIERFQWRHSPSGEVATGGQLRLTTRDLAKLGRLVLNQGRWQGRELVPKTWIDQALTVQVRPSGAADPTGQLGYGYLFWQRYYTTPCGRISGWYMSGNGGNHVVTLRDLDAVAVVTSVSYNTKGMHEKTTRLLETQAFPALACPTH